MLKGERVPLIACLTSTCVQGQEQEFYLIFPSIRVVTKIILPLC